ncbi:DUF4291 domain-containing protein [Rhizobium leguminosarum]|uniref:DUF4291 domain-containing protein n=1 Tax=Rhizobium leguminosarum TaxID=384 RepID=UPI0013DB4634|nr:DUF4291 domain-containing protein [Rhizobium leguminosarum]NEK36538.1 DUF4291 family protein [Rhizobium leguminosarum]
MTEHVIEANYDKSTIRVYQAYGAEIAVSSIAAGRPLPPFKMNRMTWIKPSFNWMMYRSGCAQKKDQEFVLALDIYRDGFEWALANSVSSSFVKGIYQTEDYWRSELEAKPVRVQWDPERDWRLRRIPSTSTIQIGLSEGAVSRYVNDWISAITDVTAIAHAISVAEDQPNLGPWTTERIYPLPPALKGVCTT